ncbi:MAG: dTMP kinase [Prevotellaceae bacterium]|nr:dTMP kinase [Prevotellaceae bacterium]
MLIVFEGLDGAGKSTQVNMLRNHFAEKGQKTSFLHFPRFEAPLYGDLIASFLRGEFGAAVHPKLVALMYAGDRRDAAPMLRKKLDEGETVILDRYVYSNIAFQCAKIDSELERKSLEQWISRMEFEIFDIPRPDFAFFLDVPSEFTERNLLAERKGDDRSYLQGKKDIHESDLVLQRKVRERYLDMTSSIGNFMRIDCVDDRAGMKSPDEIHSAIANAIIR